MALPLYTVHAGPFTIADIEAMPEDGRRTELIDGALLVSPAPARPHNDAIMHLFRLLDPHCPSDLTFYNIPYDIVIDDLSMMCPDLSVSRTAELGEKRMYNTPLLVVEVISPSSRLMDQLVKRAKYAQAGIPSYWILDPEAPSLTVLELQGDVYAERQVLSDPAGSIDVTLPFPASLTLPRQAS